MQQISVTTYASQAVRNKKSAVRGIEYPIRSGFTLMAQPDASFLTFGTTSDWDWDGHIYMSPNPLVSICAVAAVH